MQRVVPRAVVRALRWPAWARERGVAWDGAVRTVAAALGAAVLFAFADTIDRPDLDRVRLSAHVPAALGVFFAAGAALGLACAAVFGIASALARPLTAQGPRAARWVRAGLGASAIVGALSSTAFWAFSGRMARKGPMARCGPWLALAALALVATLAAHATLRGLEDARAKGSKRRAVATAIALFAVGAALVVVDANVLVALYRRLHDALELLAALSFVASLSVALAMVWKRGAARRLATGVAVAGCTWLAAFVASPALRAWHERSLPHAGRDPVYVGRHLRRVELAETRLGARAASADAAESRTRELFRRYDVATAGRDPRWDAPPPKHDPLRERLAALRSGAKGASVIVYYVDTLRRDVAWDDETMPNVAAFARSGVAFDRAYSTGSDTLRALRGLVGGTYDLDREIQGGLLDVARGAGVPTTLFIAESAAEFLGKLMPDFRFDEAVLFPDYAHGGVWGYGADRPTAGPLVDRALSWLAEHRSERTFLWLFNFDLHNWRELEREYVYGAAQRFRVPDEGRWNWRYRVVARTVDAHFGRLLDGLDDLGLTDKTIVLFVADHGEALGYRDFWVHSTFLWEPLVRVPLALRAPGLSPARVDEPVSLVDVVPTLARYLAPDSPVESWHGEDLLARLLPERPRRRHPLLMAAASDGQIVRVGVVDGSAKLVLPVDWGEPQLYDLTRDDPDDADVADEQQARTLQLMGTLLRSPIFELGFGRRDQGWK